jgi:hypothetical protein
VALTLALALDHLVIAARTLGEGVAWCEAVLGVRPDAGGRHAFMGTHNRVFAIGSPAFPQAYAEIIAIDPDLPAPTRHARWFDLDDEAMQGTLADEGPQLVHWVARCDDIVAAQAILRDAGIDSGELRDAERMTPQGLLRWRIGVRTDGRRPRGGAVPALIAWGDVHPTDAMPASGVALNSMAVAGWPPSLAPPLRSRTTCDTRADAPPLRVELSTPRGAVTLRSPHPKA